MASAWGLAFGISWGNSWGVIASTEKVGGDDHPGWDKEAWKKKKKREDLIIETIEQTYWKLMGFAPEVEVVQAIRKEAGPIVKDLDYSKELQFIEWLSEQISAIQQQRHLQELDDEEILLLLL